MNFDFYFLWFLYSLCLQILAGVFNLELYQRIYQFYDLGVIIYCNYFYYNGGQKKPSSIHEAYTVSLDCYCIVTWHFSF